MVWIKKPLIQAAREGTILSMTSACRRAAICFLPAVADVSASCTVQLKPRRSDPARRALHLRLVTPLPPPLFLEAFFFPQISRAAPALLRPRARACAPDPAESAGAAVDWRRFCGAGALGAGAGWGSRPGSADSGAADETYAGVCDGGLGGWWRE